MTLYAALVPVLVLVLASCSAAQTLVRVGTAAALQRAIVDGAEHIVITRHIDATGVKPAQGSSLGDAVGVARSSLASMRVRSPLTGMPIV